MSKKLITLKAHIHGDLYSAADPREYGRRVRDTPAGAILRWIRESEDWSNEFWIISAMDTKGNVLKQAGLYTPKGYEYSPEDWAWEPVCTRR